MGNDPGDAADHQHRQHGRVVRPFGQQGEHHQRHQRPVAGAHQHLQRSQADARQGDRVLAKAPGAACGEGAGQQVGDGHQQQHGTDQAQAGVADLHAGRQPRQTTDKQAARHCEIAHPVGQ
ncbi:hypothetical protein D9M71_633430 [compost metagenome]